jgi:hypothetical protein
MAGTTRPRALAVLGAIAVLAGGALHVRLGFDDYGTEDLVTVFFLNGVGSALVAAWIAYDRRPFALLAGLGISTVSLLAFGLSRRGDGVLGFRGVGLDPSPDVALTLLAEGVATLALGAALLASRAELGALAGRLRPRRLRG